MKRVAISVALPAEFDELVLEPLRAAAPAELQAATSTTMTDAQTESENVREARRASQFRG